MRKNGPLRIAVIFLTVLGGTVCVRADDNGMGRRASLFSDSEPLAYSSAAPPYVAPPAPPPIYIDQNARTYCRPYSQETRVAGRRQETYGTACLQPDGSWRVTQ